MSIPALMPGVLAPDRPLRLVGPDHAPRLATSRTGTAMAQNAAGAWQAVAADTPRFHGTARRLLVELARDNLIRNPRTEGSVAGTPGTPPTFYGVAGSTVNLTRTILGAGSEDGVPYFEMRLSGTPNATTSYRLALEGVSTSAPAAFGQSWALSVFLRLTGGALPAAGGPQLVLIERDAAGAALGTPQISSSLVPGGGPLVAQRFVLGITAAQAATALLTPELRFPLQNGVPVDFTYRIGAPQLEQGRNASSLILPPAGAPAAASRAAERISWSPAGGFGPQGTLVIQAMLPQTALFGEHQGLFQLDDGSDANRILLRNTSGGATLFGVVDSGGSTLATLSGGSIAAGAVFRAALAWGPGDQALCLNGGTVQGAAAALPAGLTRLLVGHGSTLLNRAANGEIALLDYRPTRLSNAMLQALTV
ncbi:hypothetical protein [Pseudoroseomonas cervicalis]|uniref:hypothetical protein n=1 Tax=Teichococcus cervicalis TaxID=204525 RepID=UPI0022F17951|nr:hypothetical protein [Pseudoroseomonas cervicalis]WBV44149.1 hypothetical protein PFY06_06180 [Pseudoroseomonas cervicalis]